MSLSLTRVMLAFCFAVVTTLGVTALGTPASAKPGYHASSKSHKAKRSAKKRKSVHYSRSYRHRSVRGRTVATSRTASRRAGHRRSAKRQPGFGLSRIFAGNQAQTASPYRRTARGRSARPHARTARRSVRKAYAARTSHGANQGGAVGGFGSPRLVAEARRYMGTNPTGRASLWCARFMNMVLERSGHRGTGSDMARSFAGYGRRVSGPRVGAIAVLSRGRSGGHVGVVSGVDGRGNPIIISGNHGRRVGEGVYPRGRVIAYVMP